MDGMTYFNEAETYNLFKLEELQHVEESSPQYTRRFRWSERHLQCIWFDNHYRPSDLTLSTGEKLTVLSPGRWNLEAGPDFLDAELRIDPGARIIHGDIEVHIYPSDWDNHGHSENRAYDNVVLHICWFSTPKAKTLPESTPLLSLSQPIQSLPWFSLDDIDIKAYPHNTQPDPASPCQKLLFNNPDYAEKLFRSAGYHRIQNKTLSIARHLEDSADREQVFYEEIMAALGYKQNKLPFRALAKQITQCRLSENREHSLALLLGAAELLPQPEEVKTEESAAFVRFLWDHWWKSDIELINSDIKWTLHGIRPNNHPTRRIAAAAALFSCRPTLLHQIDNLTAEISGKAWIKEVTQIISERCLWPYWNRQLLFTSEPGKQREHALIGAKRLNAILTNVIIPFYAAEKGLPIDTLSHLPPEDLSSPMRTAAWRLLGRDHNPALYSGNNILQQGLLQIYLDFCLPSKSGCKGCRLLKKIERELSVK